VLGFAADGDGFEIATARGKVRARHVIVGTNGYTDAADRWLRRRLVPVRSRIIATAPLSNNLMSELMPRGVMVAETRKLHYYYRPSPDGTRILFGGRVAISETDPRISAPRLHAAMVRVFPELRSAKVTHSWMGSVAFTFDSLPHIGVQDGVHYAMGYCGNGVPLSTHFGFRLAHMILGNPEGRSVFQDQTFQTRPLYAGKPWFLAPSILYYKFKDRYLS
jgi:glycine/D-amino acid oxidase-like deaminating enzyme